MIADFELTTLALDQPGTLRDAIEIADSCARADIEGNCISIDGGWFDVAYRDPIEWEWLGHAVRYLTARNLIIAHPTDANLIRFVVPA